MSTTLFTSLKNTMKRDDASGATTMAAPITPAYIVGGTPFLYVTNLTIPHSVNGVPQFRYYYEPFGDGVIWPELTDRNSGVAFNPNSLLQKGPGLVGWADSTNLYLQLFYTDNTLTGTFPVYWVIYKDFAL